MVRIELVINNKLGLHARAAGKFVEAAFQFTSEIWLTKGKNRVSGKSIMGILTLAAAKGDTVTVEVEGSDEEAALETLKELVLRGFGENQENV